MTTWKEDRIKNGFKKSFRKKKKGQMNHKEERKFFGHGFGNGSPKQKIVVKSNIDDNEGNKIPCLFKFDKNDQLCEIVYVEEGKKRDALLNSVLSHLRGIPVKLLFEIQ